MIDLNGQTALITGGSRGIGRAASLLLARAGADVAITYHTRAREAEDTAAVVRSLGRRALVMGGDLAAPEVAQRLASGVEREFGGLDIFVANAGVWPAEEVRLGDMTVKRWRTTLEANLDSVFVSTRAVLPLIRPGGRVVIVSSTAGQRGEAFHADYAATKGALIAMSSALAIRPIGMVFRMRSRFSGLNAGALISVSTQPGATQFTTRVGAYSMASDLVRAMSAPLVAA